MIPAALGQVQTAGSNVEFLHYSNRDKNQFTGQIIYLFLKFYGKKKSFLFNSGQEFKFHMKHNKIKNPIFITRIERKSITTIKEKENKFREEITW